MEKQRINVSSGIAENLGNFMSRTGSVLTDNGNTLKERIEEDNELTRTYTDLTRVQVSCKCRCRRERMEWIWKSKTLRY